MSPDSLQLVSKYVVEWFIRFVTVCVTGLVFVSLPSGNLLYTFGSFVLSLAVASVIYLSLRHLCFSDEWPIKTHSTRLFILVKKSQDLETISSLCRDRSDCSSTVWTTGWELFYDTLSRKGRYEICKRRRECHTTLLKEGTFDRCRVKQSVNCSVN